MKVKFFSQCFLLLSAILVCFTMHTQATELSLPYQELRTPKGLKVLFHKNPNATSVSLGISFQEHQAHHIASYTRHSYVTALTTFMLFDDFYQCTLEKMRSEQKGPFDLYIRPPEDVFQLRMFLNSSSQQLEANLAQTIDLLRQIRPSAARLKNTLAFMKVLRAMEISTGDPKRLAKLVLSHLFITGKFQSNPNLIIEEYFKNITIEDIEQCANRLFTQENLVIGVSGNIDSDLLLQLIDRYFGQLPPGSPPQKSSIFHRPKILAHKKTFHLNKDMPGYFSLIQQHWQFQKPQDRVPSEDLSFVLMPLVMRDLNQMLQDKNLSINILFSSMTFPMPTFQVEVNTSKAAADDVIENLVAILRRTRQQDITLEQLKTAKELYSSMLPDQKYLDKGIEPLTTSTLASLPQSAASYLLDKQSLIPPVVKPFVIGRITALIEDPQKLKAFNKAMRTYLDPDQFIILKVGPK